MADRKVSSYILPTSATMVGVSMTVLSLAKVVESRPAPDGWTNSWRSTA